MEQDIGKALAYQIKREIAERYFGYRKIIEEDRQALEAMISDLRFLYEQKIGRDIVRIYVLMRDLNLIDEFLRLTGWEGRPFFDQYVVESGTIREQLLKNMELHGWVAHSRFANLFLDSYERLYLDTFEYRKKLDEVLEEAQVIEEEISQFKEKFSFEEIMSFLRTLNRRDDLVSVLGENLPAGRVEDLSSRLDLLPVGDLEKSLPKVPELPAPDKVKSSLKDLAHRAVKAHKEEVLTAFRD
jgi:SOS response regulatory protein OraA/RecX